MNMLIQHTGITGLGSVTEQELLQGAAPALLYSFPFSTTHPSLNVDHTLANLPLKAAPLSPFATVTLLTHPGLQFHTPDPILPYSHFKSI